MIFFGEYNLQLDDKNRMRIPTKLRSFVGETFYVLHGSGGCLFVMDEGEFQKIAEKFRKIPLSDLRAQDIVRKIMSSVFIAEEDSQGRFVLPKKAKEYAGIDKQIVYIGVNSRMEIWASERYQSQGYDSCDSYDNVIGDLREYDV